MLAIMERLVVMLGNVLGITQAIQAIVGTLATAEALASVVPLVQSTNGIVSDATIGNAAIKADVDALAIQLALVETTLAGYIGGPQQAGSPVTLPVIPPGGYGAPSTSDVALAVWSFDLGHSDAAGASLDTLIQACFNTEQWHAYSWPFQPFLKLYQLNPFNLAAGAFAPNAALDPTTILPTDATPKDWVNRVYPSYAWDTVSDPNGSLWGYPDGDQAYTWWVLDFPQDEWLAWTTTPAVPPGGAPVWPGLANVTLGSPVALSTALTIATPMDGVIVDLTSVPSVRGFYQYDDLRYYLNVGSLTFVDDNGEAENYQALGPTYGVFTPKAMAHAAAVKIRGAPGVVGTVTPWQITA